MRTNHEPKKVVAFLRTKGLCWDPQSPSQASQSLYQAPQSLYEAVEPLGTTPSLLEPALGQESLYCAA